ncbi:MAG: conjugative transposon protein TraJ [Agriterribacter sp.]
MKCAGWIMGMGVALAPCVAAAQDIASEMKGLHGVLDELYSEMIPLCSQLIGVGRGIAGFAALWYIASRVWRHLSNAEPIDFYPLFRPFVIGMCILLFPFVLGLINGILSPTVTGTQAMVTGSDKAIAALLLAKEKALQQTDTWQMLVGPNGEGDYARWYEYTHDGADVSEEGLLEGIGNSIKFAMSKAAYNLRNVIKEWLSQILQLLFAAASLCINTVRTFQLVVLAILGPLAFGVAVFDSFRNTVFNWLARYMNVFLWLPVANIFGAILGKIQENMLQIDLEQIASSGDTFFSAKDMAYMVFLVIGIIGYLSVPSVANSIVQVSGVSALTTRMTMLASSASHATAVRAGEGANNLMSIGTHIQQGYSGEQSGQGLAGWAGRQAGAGGAAATSYLKDKLSGKA